jgi:hypothetical protein
MSEQTTQQSSQMGRPTKYTPDAIGKVIGSLQAGLSIDSACEHAGINPDTHYEWLKQYPDYSEKISAARLYGKILAGKQVQDILQDITREKPKYSETTRATTSRWYLEKHEKQIYGSQSMLAAKLESDGKGGQTATIVHATDGTFTDFFNQIRTETGSEEINPGQLLEILESRPEGEDVDGGGTEEPAPPIHPEELQGEHPPQEGMPQP